jgi:hypothetical protein
MVNFEVIQNPMPDMGIRQGAIQIKKSCFVRKGALSLLLRMVRRVP